MHHRTLKHVTLRFGNTPDMVETPLRPMIISGTWMAIMTLVHSTNILLLNRQRRILFPLSLRYLPCPRSDRRYHYTLFNLVTDKGYLTRSRDIPSP